MAKQLNVSVAVTADTSAAKAQLQQLQQTLTELTSNSANLKVGLDATALKQASTAADQLALHLKNATNVNTGTLDFTKLSTSIRASGSSLQDYGNQLLKLGPQGQQAFSQLTAAISKSEVPMTRIKGLLGEFGTVLTNTIRWQAASSAIHGMMGSIQHAFSYAQQLNKSLNNIQIVTGLSDTEMANFAESANKAAKSLSTTTTSYTNAALIYYQQGIRDQKQIAERVETTIKLANVSGQSAEKVSNQMTAIWNNFDDGTRSLESYADVITALGAATASSSEEIATGLSKFAAVADTVGLSYENATAALATITATTRQSADTVGTGLRTLFSRLQSLKLGETLEDGVDLTKYSKALKTIGVDVLDATGNMRQMDDILADMGEKWQNLTDAQKTATAQTVGGVRQYTTLMALMENFDFYKQNVKIAQNSEGTVQQQADIYAKSWEAAQKRVKASAESIYKDLVNDDFFIGLNNTFAGLLTFLDNVIDGLGGLKSILPGVSALLMSTFSDKISANMVNFATTLQTLKPGAAAAFRAERDSFLQNAAYSLSGLSQNQTLSASQQAQLNMAQKEIAMQQAYVANQRVMSEFDRQYAQQQMDRYSGLRQSYAQMSNKVVSNDNLLENRRSSLVSKANDDVVKTLAGSVLKSNDKLAGSKEARELFNQIKASNGSFQDWFDKDGKFSSDQYWKSFNQGLNGVTDSIKQIEQNKTAIKDFTDTSQKGIQDLTKELTGRGFKDADKAIQGMLNSDNSINEEERKKLLASLNTQQNDTVNQFANQWGLSAQAVSQYREAIIAAAGDEEKLAQIAKQIQETEEKATQAVNKRNQAMQTAQTITGVATALTSMASSANSASTAMTNILNLGKTSGGFSQITGIVSGLGSSLLMMSMTAKTLIATLGASGPVGWIIAAIPVVLGAINAIYQHFKPETEEEKIERLKTEAQDAQTAADSAKSAYDNLISSKASHNELLNELDNMIAKTNEFRSALEQANSVAREIIAANGMIYGRDYTYDENSAIRFNDGVLEAAEQRALTYSNRADLSSQMAAWRSSAAIERASLNREGEDFREAHSIAGTYGSNDALDSVMGRLFDEYINGSLRFANFDKLPGLGTDEYTALIQAIAPTNYTTSEAWKTALTNLDATYGQDKYGQLFSDYIMEWFEAGWDKGIEEGWDMPEGFDNVWTALDSWYGQFGGEIESINNRRTTLGQSEYSSMLSSLAYMNDNNVSNAENLALSYLTNHFDSGTIDALLTTALSPLEGYSNKSSLEDLRKNLLHQDENGDWFFKGANGELLDFGLNGFFNSEEFKNAENQGKALYDYLSNNLQIDAIEENLNAALEKFTNADAIVTEFEKSITNKSLRDLESYQEDVQQSLAEQGVELSPEEQEYIQQHSREIQATAKKNAQDVLNSFFGLDANKDPNKIVDDYLDMTLEDWNSAKTISHLSDLFKENLEDNDFGQILGDALFGDDGTFNNALAEKLSTIDMSSSLSALLDLKFLKDSFSTSIDDIYSTLYDTALEKIGGEVGVFSAIFGTEDFQKELKKVQKEFKKTGKVSTKNVDDIASSCDDLNEALDLNILSAGAVADAIELYSMGAINSIDDITDELWAALEAANSFADALRDAFDYIDNWNPDRSISDIGGFYGKVSKDYFTELANGTTGSERLYQDAAALGGDYFATNLRKFFYNQEGVANVDNPEARAKAYNKQYGDFDAMWKKVQESGNMQPFWEYMLGEEEGKKTGTRAKELEELYGRDVQGALKKLGLSTGENGEDIEWDIGAGMTTDEAIQGLMNAFGVSEDIAKTYFSELTGHSAALATDFQVNDFLQGIERLGVGENGQITNLEDYIAARGNNMDAGLLAQSLAHQYGIELDENAMMQPGQLGEALVAAQQGQMDRKAAAMGADIRDTRFASGNREEWDQWLADQKGLTDEQRQQLQAMRDQQDELREQAETYDQIGQELETQRQVREEITAAQSDLAFEDGKVVSGLEEGSEAATRLNQAIADAKLDDGNFNGDQLISKFQSMGMTAEQAFQNAQAAAESAGGQLSHSFTDAWGNVHTAVIENCNSVEEYQQKCQEAEQNIAHDANVLFGKQLFEGMLEGLQDLGDETTAIGEKFKGLDVELPVKLKLADDFDPSTLVGKDGLDVIAKISEVSTEGLTPPEVASLLKATGVITEGMTPPEVMAILKASGVSTDGLTPPQVAATLKAAGVITEGMTPPEVMATLKASGVSTEGMTPPEVMATLKASGVSTEGMTAPEIAATLKATGVSTEGMTTPEVIATLKAAGVSTEGMTPPEIAATLKAFDISTDELTTPEIEAILKSFSVNTDELTPPEIEAILKAFGIDTTGVEIPTFEVGVHYYKLNNPENPDAGPVYVSAGEQSMWKAAFDANDQNRAGRQLWDAGYSWGSSVDYASGHGLAWQYASAPGESITSNWEAFNREYINANGEATGISVGSMALGTPFAVQSDLSNYSVGSDGSIQVKLSPDSEPIDISDASAQMLAQQMGDALEPGTQGQEVVSYSGEGKASIGGTSYDLGQTNYKEKDLGSLIRDFNNAQNALNNSSDENRATNEAVVSELAAQLGTAIQEITGQTPAEMAANATPDVNGNIDLGTISADGQTVDIAAIAEVTEVNTDNVETPQIDAEVVASGEVDGVGDSTAVVNIEGNDQTGDDVAAATANADGATGTITIDGDNGPAIAQVNAAVAYANARSGQITVTANTQPAQDQINQLAANPIEITVSINVAAMGAAIRAAAMGSTVVKEWINHHKEGYDPECDMCGWGETAAGQACQNSFKGGGYCGQGNAGCGMAAGGLIRSYINGSANHYASPGLALTGEEGAEIVWNKQEGYAYITGAKHPQFVNLRPGDRVFNANDTRKILNYDKPDGNRRSSVLDPAMARGGLLGSYAAGGGSAYGSYGPDSKYKSNTGSGSSRASNKREKDYTPERYHYITRVIQDLTFWYDELKKARENAYGTNVLNAIDKEIDALGELRDANHRLWEEAKEYVDRDQKRLKDLGVKVVYDQHGNIANFEELQEKYRKAAESGDDENAANIWKAIEQYEESLDKMQEAWSDYTDALYEFAELRLEKIQVKAEMKINFDDKEIDYIQHFLDKIDDKIYAAADALKLVSSQMALITDKIKTTHTAIDEVFSGMVDRYGNQIGLTYADWLNMSEAERQALDINGKYGEQLEEYAENLKSYIEELEKFKTKGVEELSAAFDELNEKVTTQIGLYDHYTNMLSSLRDIADLQGIKIPREMRTSIAQLNDSMAQVTNDRITSQKEYYAELAREADLIRDKLASTTDTDLVNKYQAELDKIEQLMRESAENIVSLWQDGLNKAKDIFDQALEWAKEDYEASLSEMYGTSGLLQEAFDRKNDLADEYVDDYEKYYQLGKLQRQINKDIDTAAVNGNKANKNLKALLTEIQELQASGAELSKYDLDILEKKYEYEKALADLEDARNAKQTVRLQRDRNGNWGYVYTAADDEDLAEYEQAVEDKLYEYTKSATEQSKNLQSQILSLWAEAGEKVAQMRADGVSDEVIDDYIADTQQKLDFLMSQLEKTGTDVELALPKWMKLTNDTFNLTTDTFEETLLSVVTGMETIAQTGETITGAIMTIAEATKTAADDYNESIEALNSLVSSNEDGYMANANAWANAIVAASAQNIENTHKAVTEMGNMYDTILKKAKEFEKDFFEIYQPLIRENEEFLASLLNALGMLNGVANNLGWLNTAFNTGNNTNYGAPSFDTGGYTGVWGPDGKLAFLHQKEQVFNAKDTENLLNAANILRTLDLQTKSLSNGLGEFFSPSVKDFEQTIEQDIHITAEFPNATNHSEIEEAFNNLANRATQYANRKVG